MAESVLNPVHRELGAFINEAGRAMHYPTGTENEHMTVRAAGAIQDMSSLPIILIKGKNALKLVNFVVANDINRIRDGQMQYTGMLNEDGTFFEDITLWRKNADEWYAFPVARDKVVQRFQMYSELVDDTHVVDLTSAFGGPLALQGPRVKDTLQKIVDIDLSTLKRFYGTECTIAGCPSVIDRAGYTGENGFELFPRTEDTGTVWKAVVEAGKEFGVIPMGGAALGSLRLEKGLVGSREFTGANPFELGLDRFVRLNKTAFIGQEALQKIQDEGGPTRKLVGLELEGKDPVSDGEVLVEGEPVGKITFGAYGYFLEQNLALAIVDSQYTESGLGASVKTEGGEVQATVSTSRHYDPEDKRLRSWDY